MSENKKKPTKCNHCYSTNVIFSQWGRVEYYSCGDCKKEITEETDKLPFSPRTSWDPKQYGFGSSDVHTFDDSIILDDSMDLKKYYPGN